MALKTEMPITAMNTNKFQDQFYSFRLHRCELSFYGLTRIPGCLVAKKFYSSWLCSAQINYETNFIFNFYQINRCPFFQNVQILQRPAELLYPDIVLPTFLRAIPRPSVTNTSWQVGAFSGFNWTSSSFSLLFHCITFCNVANTRFSDNTNFKTDASCSFGHSTYLIKLKRNIALMSASLDCE